MRGCPTIVRVRHSRGEEVIIVTATAGLGQGADDIERAISLRLHLRVMKKFQMGLTRASARLFDSTGENLLRIVSDVGPNPESADPELTYAVAQLQPIERMMATTPQLRKKETQVVRQYAAFERGSYIARC
jgi:hypothetical protein